MLSEGIVADAGVLGNAVVWRPGLAYDGRGRMTLAFLERQLRDGLDRLGRHDLAEAAAGRVTFTDDGSTVYLHLFPREGWPHKQPGQAFVLAWADYQDMEGLAGFRELVRLGRLAIRDNGEQIARWLEGR